MRQGLLQVHPARKALVQIYDSGSSHSGDGHPIYDSGSLTFWWRTSNLQQWIPHILVMDIQSTTVDPSHSGGGHPIYNSGSLTFWWRTSIYDSGSLTFWWWTSNLRQWIPHILVADIQFNYKFRIRRESFNCEA